MAVIWELDFYSRPILDENQKKYWEVIICESPLTVQRSPDSLFRFSKFCDGTQVNSIWLKEALSEAIAKAPAPPSKIRFFRRQMNNMICKACKETGIDPIPSRYTIALQEWLKARETDFYPNQPGYDSASASTTSVSYPATTPQLLPDALQGQQWAYVNLEAQALDEMPEWEIAFGEAFPLALLGIDPQTSIPGLIIYSSRAVPLAAWMSGIELAYVKATFGTPARLTLESGASDAWILAQLSNPQTQQEGKNFEQAKQNAKGVHFLAIQSDPQSESFAGFWLLQEDH
ncbi:MAG: Tab2/Atab2 family RNA-binding protein [Desertifilum sp.]|nr:Tab2/Atab2 family RNA-binding protein [Desertifilum sp.]